MSGFSLLAVSLIVVVAIGSELNQSARLKAMCVCMPSRAGLIVKSAIAKTQSRSTEAFTLRAVRQ
jgi:hypothetical protein